MSDYKIPYKEYYTIGEVSRYTSVSKRALRYYEKIGALRPDYIGDNGYRYYKYETMLRLPVIRYYQLMNFSLDEITGQFEEYNYDKILDTFSDSLRECIEEIRKLEDRKTVTLGWKKVIEEACVVLAEQVNQVQVKYMEEKHYLSMDYDFNGNYHEATINLEFTNFVESKNTSIYGPVNIYFESLEERIKYELPIKAKVIQESTNAPDQKDLFIFESGVYLTKYHIGDHESLHASYKEILNYSEENNIECHDCVIERYVTDYWTLSNTDKYVTEIIIPIKWIK